MNMCLDDSSLKQLVIEINSSLYQYDRDGYSYLKRSPNGDLENIQSLRQFIECRLNLEMYYIPEISEYVKYFDGHLFTVVSVEGLQEEKRKFSKVHAEMNYSDQYFLQDPDDPKDPWDLLATIRDILGGTKISFGYSQRRVKVTVDY